MVTRRSVIVGVGGLAMSGGLVLGTGAFTQVDAQRTVSVDTAGDASAQLGLEIREDLAADSDLIGLDFDDAAGFTRGARTVLGRVLRVSNNGSQDDIGINFSYEIEGMEAGASEIFQFAHNPGEFASAAGTVNADAELPLAQGESTAYDLVLDLRDGEISGDASAILDEIDIESFDVTITIRAGADIEMDDDPPAPPSPTLDVTTTPATAITEDTAVISGEVSGIGDEPATVWFEWGDAGSGVPDMTAEAPLDEDGSFEATLSGLSPDTAYDFRAHASIAESSASGGILSFTTESTSVDADLRVQYANQQTDPNANTIHPFIRLINDGDTDVALSDVTLKYWFESEPASADQFVIDHATVGGNDVTGSFGEDDGERYLELGFDTAATVPHWLVDTWSNGDETPNVLPAEAEAGEIHVRIHPADWTNYDQSADFSWDPTITSFTDYNGITVEVAGVRVWGDTPHDV